MQNLTTEQKLSMSLDDIVNHTAEKECTVAQRNNGGRNRRPGKGKKKSIIESRKLQQFSERQNFRLQLMQAYLLSPRLKETFIIEVTETRRAPLSSRWPRRRRY